MRETWISQGLGQVTPKFLPQSRSVGPRRKQPYPFSKAAAAGQVSQNVQNVSFQLQVSEKSAFRNTLTRFAGSKRIPVTSTAAATLSQFHTSATASASFATKRISARNRKQNIQKTEKRREEASLKRPSVVLGTRPSEEAERWANCDLAKVLVQESELTGSTELQPTQFPIGTVPLPKQIGFGVTEVEKEALFGSLPLVSVEMREAQPFGSVAPQSDRLEAAGKHAEKIELEKARLFAKALDLRNANAAGIAFENRRRIVLAFSAPENPYDTGRAEVQGALHILLHLFRKLADQFFSAALLTYKIRNLWSHLSEFRRDLGNRRGLTKLVHQRAKVLRYLKQTNRDRYETILERLALHPEAVEGELVV